MPTPPAGGSPVTLVTATGALELDEDMTPLLDALAARGVDARVARWDDPDVDWSASPLTVVRSTWDYTGRRDEFLAWANATGAVTRLVNPAPVLEWNTDKRYLADLAAVGLPVVPTSYLTRGDEVDVPFDGEVVVKPSVGAGSVDAARFPPDDHAAAAAHAARLLADGRTVVVQPYQPSVDERGETALIFFGGTFSHAIAKGPMLRAPGVGGAPEGEPTGGLFHEERITPRDPDADELALARRVLDTLPRVPGVGEHLDPPVYARVDLIRSVPGEPLVLEVELTEPSVFLAMSPGAADRFAAVLLC